MRRRLDALERALGPEEPWVRFILNVPPADLTAAEHAAYVAERGSFTLDLGAAGIREPGL
jgi:hypothetical protein